MLEKQREYYTIEEYFAHEESTEFRSEYYQGEIYVLAGGSANHNRIALNIASFLDNEFESQRCEVFIGDVRLLIQQVELYTYPDVVVVCGDLNFVPGRTDTITNPTVILEILSPSTENYDRGKKF